MSTKHEWVTESIFVIVMIYFMSNFLAAIDMEESACIKQSPAFLTSSQKPFCSLGLCLPTRNIAI